MKKQIHFTPRELEVLELISLGKQRKFIAEKLGIKIPTVADHIHNLHVKTDTHLWGELVVFAKDYFKK